MQNFISEPIELKTGHPVKFYLNSESLKGGRIRVQGKPIPYETPTKAAQNGKAMANGWQALPFTEPADIFGGLPFILSVYFVCLFFFGHKRPNAKAVSRKAAGHWNTLFDFRREIPETKNIA